MVLATSSSCRSLSSLACSDSDGRWSAGTWQSSGRSAQQASQPGLVGSLMNVHCGQDQPSCNSNNTILVMNTDDLIIVFHIGILYHIIKKIQTFSIYCNILSYFHDILHCTAELERKIANAASQWCRNLMIQCRFHDPSLHHFDKAAECDRPTDRQTDERQGHG